MSTFLPTSATNIFSHTEDEHLFGWDPMPGIVSVWANREGRAIIWQREGERVTCTTERFRPWVFATTLADLAQLRSALLPSSAPGGNDVMFSYRELDGLDGSYCYLLTARDGRALERELVRGASRRLDRKIDSLNELQDEYYRVGPV